MAIDWLESVTLEGARVRLAPLDLDAHAAPMFVHFEAHVTEFLACAAASRFKPRPTCKST